MSARDARQETDVVALGNGVYQVVSGNGRQLAYAAGPADARWVFLDGQVYVIDTGPATSARQRTRRGDVSAALMAPMPATVVRIHVTPGQSVAKGDVLIMLEAMKMELPIKAPADAVVKGLACREGDLVQPGVALLELE